MQTCNATEDPFFAVWHELAAAPVGCVIVLPRLADGADADEPAEHAMAVVIAFAATPTWSNASL